MDQASEFFWIEKYFAPLAHPDFSFQLKDDVARLQKDQDWLVNTDTLVEGVHFPKGWDATKIAIKALRVNLSDIRAKAGLPEIYFLNLTVPETIDEAWISDFADGLRQEQESPSCPVFYLGGGDTTRTNGPIVVSVTMIAQAPDRHVGRFGAQPGDRVFVCGRIGDAGLALDYLDAQTPGGQQKTFIDAYERPDVDFAVIEIIEKLATASLDISDGLFADAAHIAKASNVSLEIDLDNIPLSEASKSWLKANDDLSGRIRLATSGDDYQVLFTVPEIKARSAIMMANTHAIQLTEIGEVKSGAGLKVFYNGQNVPLPPRLGYAHFT